MKRLFMALALVLLGAGCANFPPAIPLAGEFNLHPLFGDNMVLQRDFPTPVWGTATPSSRLEITIGRQRCEAVADSDGRWRINLQPMPAGGPHTMSVRGRNRIVTCRNILFGDVWLCSGQSNMQWSVRESGNPRAEIAAADYPRLRLFQVAHKVSDKPLTTVAGHWRVCSPQTVANFSAAAYYFGRDLSRRTGVPVGLIQSTWGGTPAEAWLDRAALASDPLLQPIMTRHERLMRSYRENEAAYQLSKDIQKKIRIEDMMYYNDPGVKADIGWESPQCRDEQWRTMSQPGAWEQQGLNVDGIVWFRRWVKIPAAWAGQPLELSLGAIDDFDRTYFNGVKVGGIGTENRNAWRTP
ncbi:MAG: sialate O-acetylesterase, partial [Victivallales bacterium]|nr:sialate O-acetylesterase [Victivallales bacterium]